MKNYPKQHSNGFSLLELIIAMTLTLVLLGMATTILAGAFGILKSESEKTKALIAAQSAMNLMSREIANSGFGIQDNGIVLADSGKNTLRFRANINNSNSNTTDPGEDITYFHDADTLSLFRFDPNDSAQTAVICDKINSLNFQYLNQSETELSSGDLPTSRTVKVRIALNFTIEKTNKLGKDQNMTLITDVALRNSLFLLGHN